MPKCGPNFPLKKGNKENKKVFRGEKEKKTVAYPITAAMAKVMPGARLVVALAMDGDARSSPLR